ncbi:MAG: hypothetical protein QM496_10135 [Verrucomicrobiota bacterium]
MNEKQAKVYVGFTNLSIVEQVQALKEMQAYYDANLSDQKVLEESFAKRAGVDLGPMNSGGCPCCGR